MRWLNHKGGIMTRFVRVFTTLAFVSAIVVASVFAESSSGSANADPDTIVTDCTFFDANGTPWVDPVAELREHITDNGYSLTCTGQLPADAVLPTGVMHWDSSNQPLFQCVTLDDWRSTTWPSGKARFTCHGKL